MRRSGQTWRHPREKAEVLEKLRTRGASASRRRTQSGLLAYWLMRNRADAEDVVQEAFLRAMRACDTVIGEDMRPWLLRIVRNTAYRALRQRDGPRNVIPLDTVLPGRRGQAISALEVALDEPSAEDRLVRAAEQHQVAAALARLSPDFREVLVLREMEGLSYREIAEIMETPIGTVMSRLARARAELRARVMQMDQEDGTDGL